MSMYRTKGNRISQAGATYLHQRTLTLSQVDIFCKVECGGCLLMPGNYKGADLSFCLSDDRNKVQLLARIIYNIREGKIVGLEKGHDDILVLLLKHLYSITIQESLALFKDITLSDCSFSVQDIVLNDDLLF